jgi:histidyl-tRNA synthetase
LGEQKIEPERVEEFVTILQTSDLKKIRAFIKGDQVAEAELGSLEQIISLLARSFQITGSQVNMGIVRGLEYYKGPVFEIDASVLGAEKQVCGGGAYELVSLFGGTPVPTVGFAIGFDRTILALEAEQFSFPKYTMDVYIIPVNDAMIPKSLEIAQMLRNAGIFTDVDLLRRGMGKALKYASGLPAKKVILVGPKELESNSVTLRDMQTGEQKLVKIRDVCSTIKQ